MRWSLVLVVWAWGPLSTACGQQAGAKGAPPWFGEAVDPDWLWRPLSPGEQIHCWSAVESMPFTGSTGARERVLVRADGAGVLARLWLAEARGTLRFYTGSAYELVWEIGAAELRQGGLGLPGAPWVAPTGGGGMACRVPVPFTDGLLVTTDASGDVDYQAQVLVPGSEEAARLRDFESDVLVAGAANADRCVAPWLARTDTSCTVRIPLRDLAPGPEGVLAGAWQGPGVLRSVRVRIEAEGQEVDRLRRLASIRFVVDGDPCGTLPLTALRAGTGSSVGVLLRDVDGTDVLRVAVPCRASIRLELSLEGDGVAEMPDARIEVVSDFEPRPVPADALRFSIVRARSTALVPGSMHVALGVSGAAGRFAGMVVCADNPGDGFFGGGGERIRVDGEDTARWQGTGLDAYVGAALASPSAFTGAFEGQPVVPRDGYRGRTQAFRFHMLDAVPFRDSIEVAIAAQPFGATPFGLETFAFVYADRPLAPHRMEPERGPANERPTESAAAAPPPPPPIEGEDLVVRRVGGGRHEVQKLHEFSGARWSGNAHLWWLDGEPGDRLVVDVPVPARGRYRLLACWTTARDYGMARVFVGGQPVGGAFDLYTEQVRNTGLVEHGITTEIEAGVVQLEIELVGRNAQAVPRHMVGLDFLRLVPVPTGSVGR